MTDFPSNPCDATLVDVAAALKSGKVSSREVTEASIARFHARGKPLNLVAGMDEDAALKQAAEADANPATTPLWGVPLAHKDMFYRPGRLSECGSAIRKGFMPDVLSGALSRLDQAGALDIARLNMVEFALGVTGHNEITGNVRNPWNPAHVTGGSSSGSGASVAARATFAALGSDTGGSVRLPAACCGVVGMKVTMGRVSRFGAMPLSHTLDTIGPLTRTVTDNALMLSVIAGYDQDDASSADVPVADYLAGIEDGVAGLKIGLPNSHFMDGMDEEPSSRFADTVEVLKKAGTEFVDVDLPDIIQYTNALTSLITATEGAALHQQWMETRGNEYGKQTFARFAGGFATPATRYVQALNLRTRALADFNELVFGKVDVLMTPMMVMDVPSIAETDMKDGPNAAAMLQRVGHCSRPVNFLGLPGLSVPTGFTAAGLPSSVQFIGRPFDEATLYRVGRAYERETEWFKTAPDPGQWESIV
ncbi:amidase [Thalassospiraceae bacterium LMO-JJ14]|nr:amidase [Thalassospiraceae bacterium LMO-JJ14]